MRPTSVLLLSGFLGTAPTVFAAPWSKLNIGRPWLSRGQGEEETREGSQQQHQHHKQQVLLPVSPFSEHQADRSPSPPQDNNNETHSNNTLPKWLQKYTPSFVAFGDSYSAGIGTTIPAGTTENACRQGTGAYPFLIYSDFLNRLSSSHPNKTNHLGHGHNETEPIPSLQWLSCTGSTTDDVLSSPSSSPTGNDSQIDMFNYTSSPSGGGVKFATLSIGGNDVGFFEVINACVFRFYSFYSGTCEEALTRSEKLIAAALEYMSGESPAFLLSRQVGVDDEEKNGDGDGDKDDEEDGNLKKEARLITHKITLVLLEILDKIHWERHPDFRIILTGYARFFNAETVPCDEVSLGVWWDSVPTSSSTPGDQTADGNGDGHKNGSNWGDGYRDVDDEGLSSYRPKLKREVRKRMNILVKGVNQLLEEIVAGVNARFTPPSTGSQSEERHSQKNKTKKKVIFVNYDNFFEGHRFCEDGVKEPDYERVESWFFLPGGGDNLPLEPAPPTPTPASAPPPSSLGSRSPDGAAEREGKEQSVYERERQVFLSQPDSHLVEPNTCLEEITKSERGGGDWGRNILCYMAIVKKRDPDLVLDRRLVPELMSVMETDTPRPLNRDSMWYVPTYYGKTFHPRSLAHRVIRDRIYEVWAQEEEGEEEKDT